MTRDEFQARQSAADALCRGYIWGIIYAIWFGMTLAVIILLGMLCWSFSVDGRAERATILWELGFCVLLFGGAQFVYRVRSGKVKELSVRCPACRRFVSRKSEKKTLETGRCAECDAQIIDEGT
jgi:hypothetical protein